MEFRCRIHKPFYDWNGRKYVQLIIKDDVITAKVPFRYNRVMCHVEGIKTVQEFKKDENIYALLDKKIWNGETFWILHGVREVADPVKHGEPDTDRI